MVTVVPGAQSPPRLTILRRRLVSPINAKRSLSGNCQVGRRSRPPSSGRIAAPLISAASASDEPWLCQRTGLVLDPYFSATKIRWLLEQDAELRKRAEAGELACGTIDSWLIWKLTGGKVHATDVTQCVAHAAV